jgi:hypothetical protein
VSVPWSSFRPCLFERGEGLAPFRDRVRSGAVPPDLSAATSRARKGNRGPTRDLGKKTGRSIRCPARIRPLHQARTGSSAMGQADGRQPFMPLECLTTPAFEIPSVLLVRGGCGRSCRARWERLSFSDELTLTDFPSYGNTCKSIALVWLI